jgi:hypothetical protein
MSSHRRALLLIATAVACGGEARSAVLSVADSLRTDSIARARQDSINRLQPGYVVDSILPIEEEARRFRAAIGGDSVGALQNASPSREALVQRFVKALASRDSADLRSMAISPREFVDLVYPSSPYTRAPYRQSPGLTWMQFRNPSESGLRRLLGRFGGKTLTAGILSCEPKPARQGANLIWTGCTLRLTGAGALPAPHRYFGSILERDRLFKFVGYANEL